MGLQYELNQFHGTSRYHYLTFAKNIKCTDGIAHLCKLAKCYWLLDIIASVQYLDKVKAKANFLIWSVTKDKEGAVVTAHWDSEGDGKYSDEKLVYEQVVDYTDFPFKELGDRYEFYQQGDVILLKAEH